MKEWVKAIGKFSFTNFKFWLAASIIAAILFSLSGFGLSLQSGYTIQDDARQHVFWLQRLNDPDLFPNDAIADYLSSVAPAGYKFLYWLANSVGLEPFTFNKILPLLLGIGNSIYCYLVTIEIFPVPMAGFLTSLLLNQNLWLLDDLVSGTPRAFFYVLFLGFVYYLLRRELLPCLLFIVLQSLFYPQTVLISAGVFSLNLVTQKQEPYFYLVGLVTAVITLGIYKLQTGEFSEVITLETARQLPEFYPGGRSEFFSDNPWHFWLSARRSGFFPFEWQYSAMWLYGLSLPIVSQFPRKFPLVRHLNAKVKIIGQMLLTSLGLFCLSHVMLFRLHLPSRYSQHTWRIAIALATGMALTLLLHQLVQKITPSAIVKGVIIAIALSIILYPTYAVQSYSYRLGYVTGKAPQLYQFLQQQPKDVVIASLSSEADFIPSLARRTVLVSAEYSIPYHLDYYAQMRQRAKDLIQAQYTSSQAVLNRFIRQYRVDLWLLDRQAFAVDYLTNNSWLNQFPLAVQSAIASLQDTQPVIMSQSDRCSIWQTTELKLLDAKCLLKEERE